MNRFGLLSSSEIGACETEMTAKETDRCSRRNFLEKSLYGIGGIALGSYTLIFTVRCSDDGPTGSSEDVKITIDLSLPENQALASVGGSLALSANDLDEKGILLYRDSETTVNAYSRECTHQSCVIEKFKNGVSICPCHGSRFNTSGSVINGPATEPLKEYSATLDGEIVTVTP